MKPIDIEVMKEIVLQTHEVGIFHEYGEAGSLALRTLLENLPKLYEYINPEVIKNSFIVFRHVAPRDIPESLSKPTRFTNLAYLAAHCDVQRSTSTTIIQIYDSNEFHVWKGVYIEASELAQNAIVYTFSKGKEYIITAKKSYELQNPSPLHASVFAIPTYRTLEEALDHYKYNSIKTSRCPIFSEAWEGGNAGNRLYFQKKPEEHMRKSLQYYLQNVLRDAYVHPEINVDESHPVDIQVIWELTNRAAIIEIKWLGKSMSDSGEFLSYSDSRARAGAKQLAEYLDAKRTWDPMHETIGYLVVIDARRNGLKPSSTTIDETNGLWYKDKEIQFVPEYHKSRSDFAEPIRMFAEPKCSPS